MFRHDFDLVIATKTKATFETTENTAVAFKNRMSLKQSKIHCNYVYKKQLCRMDIQA